MVFADTLSFSQVLWIIPILFALHNLEEAPGMERWSKAIHARRQITTPQFSVAVILLTIVVFVIAILTLQNTISIVGIYILLAVQAAIFFNAFVPHIFTTIYYRRYSPGLITAVVFNIPFSVYLSQRASQEQYLRLDTLLLLLLIAPFLTITGAMVSLKLGAVIVQFVSKSSGLKA